MASRFIEDVESSENASKIFFSSSFLILGRKKVEIGETAILYLPHWCTCFFVELAIFFFFN